MGKLIVFLVLSVVLYCSAESSENGVIRCFVCNSNDDDNCVNGPLDDFAQECGIESTTTTDVPEISLLEIEEVLKRKARNVFYYVNSDDILGENNPEGGNPQEDVVIPTDTTTQEENTASIETTTQNDNIIPVETTSQGNIQDTTTSVDTTTNEDNTTPATQETTTQEPITQEPTTAQSDTTQQDITTPVDITTQGDNTTPVDTTPQENTTPIEITTQEDTNAPDLTTNPTEPTTNLPVQYKCYFENTDGVITRGCIATTKVEECRKRDDCRVCERDLCNTWNGGVTMSSNVIFTVLLATVMVIFK